MSIFRATALLGTAAALLVGAAPALADDGPCGGSPCAADLSLSARTTVSPVASGGTTELHLTAVDNGPEIGTQVTATFTPPTGVKVVSYPGSCEPTGAGVVCDIDDLSPGENAETVLVLRGDAPGNYDLTGTIASANTSDNNPTNDTARGGLQVNPGTAGASSSAAGSSGPGSGSSGNPLGTPRTVITGTGGQTLATAAAKSGARKPGFRVTTRSKHRLLKDGGIALHFLADGAGTLDVRANVSLPGGKKLKLAMVWKAGVKSAQDVKVWLGTTGAMKSTLRRAFKRHRHLTAHVRIAYGPAGAVRVVTRTVTVTA